MKALIITGPSGSGKSTTIVPYLNERLNGFVWDTGDIFKAQLGWQRIKARKEHGLNTSYTVKTGNNALVEFVKSGRFRLGLCEYERGKSCGEISGFEIIEYIEIYRSLCGDLPSISVNLAHKLLGSDAILITTAVNDYEFDRLIDLYGKSNVFHIKLMPTINLVKRNGDNRNHVSAHGDFCMIYNWKSLDQRLELLVNGVKKWLKT